MIQDPGKRIPYRRSSRTQYSGSRKLPAALTVSVLIFWTVAVSRPSVQIPGISKAAAESCSAKVEKLEAFAAKADPAGKQTTRFTQDEINSYLALDLSANYNPCLKSLTLVFEEGGLRSDATIDFDRLGMSSNKLLGRIMASMLSGTHELSVNGKLIAQAGKAHFQLEEARFDKASLPSFLVEEIVTAVARRQRPPFDPMQPTQMPYKIDKVELHPAYIVVHQ